MPNSTSVNRCFTAGVAFLVTLFATLTSNADLILTTNNTVVDDETDLEWLNPSETINLSYNAVFAELTGGIYDGWRYAARNEIITLWSNAGFTPVIASANSGRAEAADGFIDIFGPTFQVGNTSGILGLYNDGRGSRVGTAEVTHREAGRFFPESYSALAINNAVRNNRALNKQGSWLVRDVEVSAVPEPSLYVLCSLGLVMMVCMKRFQKQDA